MAEEFKQLLNLLNSEDNSVRQSAEDKYASLGLVQKDMTHIIWLAFLIALGEIFQNDDSSM